MITLKKIALFVGAPILFIVLLLSCILILFGEKTPNEEPGTITKAQYKKLKEGMTKEDVKEMLGSPDVDDQDIQAWDYKGINGVGEDAKVTLFFDDNKLSSIMDDGLTKRIDTSNTNLEETDDPEFSTEFAIEEAVGETVEWDDETLDVVDQVEVNDNYGKNDGSKLILAHLNAPVSLTSNLTKKTVQKQTLEIAKEIKESTTLDFEVDSITYFWYLPLTDVAGNTKRKLAYKIQLERDTLDNLNYDSLNSIDLPAIADQYNVMFND